jgi:gliding motility-associated-like protein
MLYYIPNSFTPDGNEHNNVFNWVFTSGFNPASFTAKIYNRWGELIYQTNDVDFEWDGSYKGIDVMDGIYVWKLSYTTTSGIEDKLVGHIGIIR